VLFLLCYGGKSPLNKNAEIVQKFSLLIENKLFTTLHPSQVIAPKCTPEDGALQTQHGKALKISATVGLLGFSLMFYLLI
jgi:hypothetical protein